MRGTESRSVFSFHGVLQARKIVGWFVLVGGDRLGTREFALSVFLASGIGFSLGSAFSLLLFWLRMSGCMVVFRIVSRVGLVIVRLKEWGRMVGLQRFQMSKRTRRKLNGWKGFERDGAHGASRSRTK